MPTCSLSNLALCKRIKHRIRKTAFSDFRQSRCSSSIQQHRTQGREQPTRIGTERGGGGEAQGKAGGGGGGSKNRRRDRQSASQAHSAHLAMQHDGILIPLSAGKVVQEPAW